MTKYHFLFVLLIFCQTSFGQISEKEMFAAPLEIPLVLSGNFGELRNNHFHTGIDIKTQGVSGKRVLAAADGKVARISVSPYGYGKAIYIDHADGYQTVYGHLSKFSDKIDEILKAKQYTNESFSVDFVPTENIFVQQGELIALSGNSGSSGGPHLHFEIRKNGKPQNPLLYDFAIADKLPPRIRGLRVYPQSGTVDGSHKAQSFVVKGEEGKYRLKNIDPITVSGDFSLAVHVLDFLNGAPNKCGIYSIELFIGPNLVCSQRFDELDFRTVRNINSYKDFEVYKMNKWHYHKSFIEPGNELEIYSGCQNEGIISGLAPGKYDLKYVINDAYGNKSELEFEIIVVEYSGEQKPQNSYAAFFQWSDTNSFDLDDELHLMIPKGSLYTDLYFEFGKEMRRHPSETNLYSIHNKYVPLEKAFELKINIEHVFPDQRDQLVGTRTDPKGKKSYINGKVEENYFVLSSKSFGKFAIEKDSVAPEIKPYKNAIGGTIPSKGWLYFALKDSQSGIAYYRAELNGEWVVLEYNPKKGRVELNLTEANFQKGENTLKVICKDGVGNKSEELFTYTY